MFFVNKVSGTKEIQICLQFFGEKSPITRFCRSFILFHLSTFLYDCVKGIVNDFPSCTKYLYKKTDNYPQ